MKNKISILVRTLHLFYALLLAVIFFGCGESAQDRNNRYNLENPRIIEIDKCEYLVIEIYSGMSIINRGITHKGNCKFCAERSKK